VSACRLISGRLAYCVLMQAYLRQAGNFSACIIFLKPNFLFQSGRLANKSYASLLLAGWHTASSCRRSLAGWQFLCLHRFSLTKFPFSIRKACKQVLCALTTRRLAYCVHTHAYLQQAGAFSACIVFLKFLFPSGRLANKSHARLPPAGWQFSCEMHGLQGTLHTGLLEHLQ